VPGGGVVESPVLVGRDDFLTLAERRLAESCAGRIRRRFPPQPDRRAGPPIPSGQAGHLLGELLLLHAGLLAAEEPPDQQLNHCFLAGHRGARQPALIPAVHPARCRAARRAYRLRGACPGLDADRSASNEDPLDRDSGQVRKLDAQDLKIARRA
jgi:hypothetical protein